MKPAARVIAAAITCIAASLMIAAPAGARASAWTSQGGGPAHTGQSSVRTAQLSLIQVIGWPYQTGDEIESSPVVARNGTVYVGSDDDHVYAVNPNGLVRWRFTTQAAVRDGLALGPNGWIYAVDAGGTLHALTSAGRQRWRARVGKGAPSAVVTASGTVYAPTANGITAFTLRGRRLWSSRLGETDGVAVSGGAVYVSTQSGRVVALDGSGHRRWGSASLGSALGIPTAAPNGDVYVGALSGQFVKLDGRGRVAWSRRLRGAVEGSAALRPGGGVYIGAGIPGRGGQLTALNGAGRRLWSFATPGGEVFSSPAIGADGTVYFGSGNAFIYAVRANGRLKWSYQTGKDVDSSPAIGPDGTLYVGSFDGSLYAFAGPAPKFGGAPVRGGAFTPAAKVAGRAALRAPGAVAVDPGGRMFVADLTRSAVVELSAAGRSIGVLGRPGFGPGHFEVPTGVAVDDRARVFVSDGVNVSVQEFTPTRGGYAFTRAFVQWRVGEATRRLVQPLAVAVSANGSRVYVGDARYGVVAFTDSGRFLGSWRPGSQYVLRGLTTGRDGNVYATFNLRSGAPGGQRSYRISANLKSRKSLGLSDPSGAPYIAVDRGGRFFVLGVSPPGTVTKFEQVPGGFQELSFILPPPGFEFGLAIDRADRVYIPSFGNSPAPRGAVRAYSPITPADPASNYRLTRRIRGG